MPWFVGFLAKRGLWALITLFIYATFLFFFIGWWVPYTEASAASEYGAFLMSLLTGDAATCTAGPNPLAEGGVGLCIGDTLPVTLFIFAVGSVLAYLMGSYFGRVGAWRRAPVRAGLTSTMGILSITVFPPFLVFVLVWLAFDPMYDLLIALGVEINNAPLWNGAPLGQGEVFYVMTVALIAAMAAGLVLRGLARRKRWWAASVLAIPGMVVVAGAGIAISGLGPYALDLMFRYGRGVAVASGSPVLALFGYVLIAFGQVLFMMRVSVEDERAEDYVLTAWAKGLTKREIRDVHIARNAMAPTLATTFLTLPTVLAGMIIVEVETELHGLASQFFVAVANVDVPNLMVMLLVLGGLGVVMRIVTDVVIAILDPRQRQGMV